MSPGNLGRVMSRVRSLTVALRLALGAVALAPLVVPTAVEAADKPKVSKAVGEPLKKAQEAMGKKQFDVALQEINKAKAVEKRTPFEDYQIDEFLGYILIQQKKY